MIRLEQNVGWLISNNKHWPDPHAATKKPNSNKRCRGKKRIREKRKKRKASRENGPGIARGVAMLAISRRAGRGQCFFAWCAVVVVGCFPVARPTRGEKAMTRAWGGYLGKRLIFAPPCPLISRNS